MRVEIHEAEEGPFFKVQKKGAVAHSQAMSESGAAETRERCWSRNP